MQIFLENSNRKTADQPYSYCLYIHTNKDMVKGKIVPVDTMKAY